MNSKFKWSIAALILVIGVSAVAYSITSSDHYYAGRIHTSSRL